MPPYAHLPSWSICCYTPIWCWLWWIVLHYELMLLVLRLMAVGSSFWQSTHWVGNSLGLVITCHPSFWWRKRVLYRGFLRDGYIPLLVVPSQNLTGLFVCPVSVGILFLELWMVHLVLILWHGPIFVILESAVLHLHWRLECVIGTLLVFLCSPFAILLALLIGMQVLVSLMCLGPCQVFVFVPHTVSH